jgi:hypothetical protein
MRKLRKVLPVVTMSARGAETAQLGIQFYWIFMRNILTGKKQKLHSTSLARKLGLYVRHIYTQKQEQRISINNYFFQKNIHK